jgi:hypothetical protein
LEDLDCSDFAAQEEAQAILDDDRADPNVLGREPEDGVVHEGLPDRRSRRSVEKSPSSPRG